MKRFLSLLLLICVVLLSFAACDNKGENATDTGGVDSEINTDDETDEDANGDEDANDGEDAADDDTDSDTGVVPGGSDEEKYDAAKALIAAGEYEEAYEKLVALGDYRDAREMLGCFRYIPARIKNTVTEYGWEREVELTLSYSETGFVVERSEDEEFVNRADFIHDADGRLIKTLGQGSFDAYSDHSLEYTYDENGNVIREVLGWPRSSDKDIVEYTYDAKGNKIKAAYIYYYDDTYETYAERGYSYDASGRLIGIVEQFHDSTEEYTYEYDAKGRLTRETVICDGEIQGATEYMYDAKGNLIKEIKEQYGSVCISDYTYDANGNRTKAKISKGDYGYTDIYEYDENGNLVRVKRDFLDGHSISSKVAYDFVYIPYALHESEEEQLNVLYQMDQID